MMMDEHTSSAERRSVYNPLHNGNFKMLNIDDNYLRQQGENIIRSDLKRELQWPELILIGIGCTIGIKKFPTCDWKNR